MTSHDVFLRRVRESHRTVDLVARWFAGRGHVVVVPAQGDGPDEADLFLALPVLPVEVKHRGRAFTSVESFPFDTVLVGRVAHHEKTRPWGYVMVNNGATGALLVSSDTRAEWDEFTLDDPRTQPPHRVFECPKGLTRYVDLA